MHNSRPIAVRRLPTKLIKLSVFQCNNLQRTLENHTADIHRFLADFLTELTGLAVVNAAITRWLQVIAVVDVVTAVSSNQRLDTVTQRRNNLTIDLFITSTVAKEHPSLRPPIDASIYLFDLFIVRISSGSNLAYLL